jgi:hypothetical protein
MFDQGKLKKFERQSKISKYESCRARILLQLSRRVIYVFLNRLRRKSLQSLGFSWRGQGDIQALTEILEAFPLGFSNVANWMNCVPRDNEQLSYWPILKYL